MDMKDYDINFKEKRTNGYLIATLFIIVGILFLLRNLGMIDPSLFDLLVSWPMLLVVSGIFTIFHRNPVGGMLLVGVGVYFLFPQLNWITNDFLRVYWPLGLILLGLVIMLKRKDSIRTKKHKRPFIITFHLARIINRLLTLSCLQDLVKDKSGITLRTQLLETRNQHLGLKSLLILDLPNLIHL